MTATAPAHFLIMLGPALHGAPLLVLTGLVLAVWLTTVLNDGSSALTALLTAALLICFVIQLASPLAPRFQEVWSCANRWLSLRCCC
jgi:uncharacterized membrane protein